MGIRVHKRIGYAVDNIKRSEDKYHPICDERFDIEKWEAFWREGHKLKATDLAGWCEEHTEEIAEVAGPDMRRLQNYDIKDEIAGSLYLLRLKELQPRYTDSLAQCIVCQEEFGIGSVFHISPMSAVNWRRYDDPIDWAEETKFHGQLDRFEWLSPYGMFPYDIGLVRCGEVTRKNLGQYQKFYKAEAMNKMLDKGYIEPPVASMLLGTWDEKTEPFAEGPLLEELQNNWRCHIPLEIHCMLLRAGFIKDVLAFVNQLRPMMYIYWE